MELEDLFELPSLDSQELDEGHASVLFVILISGMGQDLAVIIGTSSHFFLERFRFSFYDFCLLFFSPVHSLLPSHTI